MLIIKYAEDLRHLAELVKLYKDKLYAEKTCAEPHKQLRLIMHPVTKYKLLESLKAVTFYTESATFMGVKILYEDEMPIDEIEVFVNVEKAL